MITAFPYHIQLRDYLKKDTKTWEWFSSRTVQEEHGEKFKESLLKNSYRISPEERPELYAYIDKAKEVLGLQTAVTVYQAQQTMMTNAGISFFGNEAHLVLSGQILQLLTGDELLSVVAHELSHIVLSLMEQGELDVADRIITAIANDARSELEYVETARISRLYSELFCDRGSLLVVNNEEVVISSLVKINTGLSKVSAQSYIKQAEEIFAGKEVSTEGVSHPENFIRARAAHLFHTLEKNAEAEIVRMIEGPIDVDKLDLFRQRKLHDLTLMILKLLLKPKWIQTDAVMSLARQYNPEFTIDTEIMLDKALLAEIKPLSDSAKEYLSYCLLDFAKVDATLENVPTGLVFQLSEDLGLKEQFNKLYKREFKLSDKKLEDLKKKALADLSKVAESAAEQIYEE